MKLNAINLGYKCRYRLSLRISTKMISTLLTRNSNKNLLKMGLTTLLWLCAMSISLLEPYSPSDSNMRALETNKHSIWFMSTHNSLGNSRSYNLTKIPLALSIIISLKIKLIKILLKAAFVSQHFLWAWLWLELEMSNALEH